MKKSTPERRREARIPVTLDALVHFRSGKSWVCTIRDFCSVGMYVQGDAGALRLALGEADDQSPLEVRFTTPGVGNPATQHHLTGIPVRRLDDALGVHFPKGMADQTLRSLIAFSKRDVESNESLFPDFGPAGSSASSIDATRARKLAAACAKPAGIAIGKLTDEFFALFLEELVGCEKRASSMSDRDQYLYALKTLPTIAPRVRTQMVDSITDQFKNLSVARRSSAPAITVQPPVENMASKKGMRLFDKSQLALVEKAEFEQWLVVAETVTAIERQLGEEIYLLKTWLGLLQPDWKNKDCNPVCPASIAHTLKEALLPLEFKDEVIRVAFTCFARIAQSRLGAFYDKLIANLEKTGLFPSAQALASSIKPRRTSVTSGSATGESDAEVGLGTEGGPTAERGAAAGRGPNRSTSNARTAAQPSAGGSGITNSGPNEGASSSADIEQLRAGVEAVSAGLDRIFQMAQQTSPRSVVETVSEPTASNEVIISALGQMQRSVVADDHRPPDQDLKHQIAERLKMTAGKPMILPAKTEKSLDMVSSLVRAVEQDEVLSMPLRQLFRRLELTLGKEAIRNEGLLSASARQRPALEILNQLEAIDVGVSREDKKLGETVEQVTDIVTRLIDEWDVNGGAFEQASRQLSPLADRQKKIYQKNLDRIVSTSEGRSRLRRAKQVVLRRMIEMLEGRKVASSLLEIVNPAWRNLLVNTALRHGTRSIEWKQQLQVIYRLVVWMHSAEQGKPVSELEKGNSQVMMRSLVGGLATIGVKPIAGVMDRLSAVMAGKLDQDEFVKVEAGQIVQMFGWDDIDRTAEPMPPVGNDKERRRWLENLGRARTIHPGESIKFIEPDGSANVCTLAWVDPTADHFVFVNKRGVQSHDLMLGELTDLLNGGRARLLEDSTTPLLDRVSDRMVQDVHTRVTADAQRDELTSLVNRKAFERSLDKLLDMSRDNNTTHCVLQIDIDGFRTLNSAFGIDGGDRLLRRIARLIEEVVENRDVVIGRLGADEFGVVLYRSSVGEGLDVANDIVKAIREVDFSWQGRQSRVAATVGVLAVSSSTESAHQMLRNVGSACQSGKQLGGDRACPYTEDNEAIQEQRATMQLATQVETWLAEGRVELTVQKIAPADGNTRLKGHFEVLITVKDESGAPKSPVLFIEAAERHGKMPIVDRFVVSRALEWMGKNPQALKDISGLSINLSGQSMNQEDFLGFVLEEFEKTGAAPDKVCFEITETAAIGNMFRATEFMQKIKVMGCRFSLDDFGSGMSSYGYLRKLPVDYLKIDGSFVKNMVTDENDRAVVRSINEIGHFLGKKTVAEYVHDDATRLLACEIGIDFLQGWGIEKPKPIDALLSEYPLAERSASTST